MCAAPAVNAVTDGTAGTTETRPVMAPGIPEYHWMKYLGSVGTTRLWDAGQINAGHLEAIKAAGIVSVVNMRKDGSDISQT